MDLVEKDYVLGWILYGICSSSISDKLTFKGGTSLSKVYFPGRWRMSEDLDFTLLDDTEMPALGIVPHQCKRACVRLKLVLDGTKKWCRSVRTDLLGQGRQRDEMDLHVWAFCKPAVLRWLA
ncbi:MAG: nucleotidyl transferase AbiEii/AbiGii toxin family protein [Thermoproteota archaeon]